MKDDGTPSRGLGHEPETSVRNDRGQVASAISREIVSLHARLYGRGPTKARTYLQRDYALCILEDVFTTAERTLVDGGSGEHVEATRAAFQDTVGDQFIAIVERASGRKVRAFMSHTHIPEEIAAELFLFAPEPGESGGNKPGRDGLGPDGDGRDGLGRDGDG